MAEPTLYLFDGYNLLHAGDYRGVDAARSTSWRVSSRCKGRAASSSSTASGEEVTRGPLEVRFAPHADTLLERLAAEHRDKEWVCLVSSDVTIRETSGQAVRKLSSSTFLRGLGAGDQTPPPPGQLSDRLDEKTRLALERLRRGEKH